MTLTVARATCAKLRGRAVCTTLALAAVLSSAAPARAQSADVHLETDGKSDLFVRTELVTSVPVRSRYGTTMVRAPVYDPLCVGGTCDKALAPGTYYLGLAKPGGAVIEGSEPVAVNPGDTVLGTYTDRSAVRIAGALTLVIPPLVGMGLILGGLGRVCDGTQPCDAGVTNAPLVVTGASLMFTGLIAGFVMMAQKDSVSFMVTPMNFGAPLVGRESGASSAIPNGLQLTMRF